MTTLPEPRPAAHRDDLQPPPPVRLVPVAPFAAAPVELLFGGLARLRGRRALHPRGVVTTARLHVPDDASLPERWRALDGVDGIARFSKATGLPGNAPDVLGLALRFGRQDLLLASVVGASPVAQHLLVPSGAVDRATFSSLLPYRAGDVFGVVQGHVVQRLTPGPALLDAVRHSSEFIVELSVVGLAGGRVALGRVVVGHTLQGDDAARVRFDPWRTGASLMPAGPFQRLRAAAYAASRRQAAR